MKRTLIGLALAQSLTSAYAEELINTETNSWKSIPITVDEDQNTYTTEKGYLMPEGNYYFTFSGYRCLKTKITSIKDEPLTLTPTDSTHSKIYCYKA